MIAIYSHKWTSVYGQALNDKGDLTIIAQEWQLSLAGFPAPVVAAAMDELSRTATAGMFPDLGAFRDLCLKHLLGDIPSPEQSVYIIAKASSRVGSVANRYKHHFVLAITKDEAFDSFRFNKTTVNECLKIVKPIHKRLLVTGWAGFSEDDFKHHKALPYFKAKTKTAKSNLSQIHGLLK